MVDPDLRKLAELVKGIVKDELKPVKAQLSGLDTKVSDMGTKVTSLDTKVTGLTKQVTNLSDKATSIEEQVAYLTEKVDGEIIPTLQSHSKYLKVISDSQEKSEDNIMRLDKRLLDVEAKQGIQAAPEFQIIK